MTIISIIIVLIIVGLLLWVIQLLPIDANIQRLIQVVAVVAVVIWLINRFVPGVLV